MQPADSLDMRPLVSAIPFINLKSGFPSLIPINILTKFVKFEGIVALVIVIYEPILYCGLLEFNTLLSILRLINALAVFLIICQALNTYPFGKILISGSSQLNVNTASVFEGVVVAELGDL